MNIEEFYEADERRRESQEIELGNEWTDSLGHPYDLSYVVATGELYVMAAPEGEVAEDTFGDTKVLSEPVEALTVEVLAIIPTVDELHQLVDGWEDAMATKGSIDWLRSRVGTAAAG